jgi:hypothetical protein
MTRADTCASSYFRLIAVGSLRRAAAASRSSARSSRSASAATISSLTSLRSSICGAARRKPCAAATSRSLSSRSTTSYQNSYRSDGLRGAKEANASSMFLRVWSIASIPGESEKADPEKAAPSTCAPITGSRMSMELKTTACIQPEVFPVLFRRRAMNAETVAKAVHWANFYRARGGRKDQAPACILHWILPVRLAQAGHNFTTIRGYWLRRLKRWKKLTQLCRLR